MAEKKTKVPRVIAAVSAIFLFSLVAPFLTGLLYAGINGERLSRTFDKFYRYLILSGVLFLTLGTLEIYFLTARKELAGNFKHLWVVLIAVGLSFMFSVVFGGFISVYAMPLVLAGLLIATLVDPGLALLANILTDIVFFAGYATANPALSVWNAISAISVQALSGSLMIIFIRKHYTRMNFIMSAVGVGLCVSAPVSVLSGFLSGNAAWSEVLINGVWSLVSVLLGLALFMIFLPICEYLFAMFSDFRLEELCSPDAKLIKKLAKEAPGTYNHSLAVGNLAEICAIKIGENPVLAKAGAYYHDIGKLCNPLCFTENQTDYNPHDDFIPEVSVSKITEHTVYGAELIRQNRLPDILGDIAVEHHGTTPVQYFLNKVKGITDEQLSSEQFCYPGPKPGTKTAGLIMIVDTVEAATRSREAQGEEQSFRDFVHGLIVAKMRTGQFTECPLTFKDFNDIEDALVETLPGLYHRRIKYEEKK